VNLYRVGLMLCEHLNQPVLSLNRLRGIWHSPTPATAARVIASPSPIRCVAGGAKRTVSAPRRTRQDSGWPRRWPTMQ
jgi:hypothetical protein